MESIENIPETIRNFWGKWQGQIIEHSCDISLKSLNKEEEYQTVHYTSSYRSEEAAIRAKL